MMVSIERLNKIVMEVGGDLMKKAELKPKHDNAFIISACNENDSAPTLMFGDQNALMMLIMVCINQLVDSMLDAHDDCGENPCAHKEYIIPFLQKNSRMMGMIFQWKRDGRIENTDNFVQEFVKMMWESMDGFGKGKETQ